MGPSWRQLGGTWPTRWQLGGKLSRQVKLSGVKRPCGSDVEPSWGRLGVVLGLSWGYLEIILEPLGVILGPPWGLLGRSWGLLGGSGGHLEVNLDVLRRESPKSETKTTPPTQNDNFYGPDEVKLEPSWDKFSPSWGQVAVLKRLGTILEGTWRQLGRR